MVRTALTSALDRNDGPPTDPKPFEALVCVRTEAGTSPEQFAAYLRAEPAVVQAWRVAADIDAVVRLACMSLRNWTPRWDGCGIWAAPSRP